MSAGQNNIKLSDFDMYVNGTKVYPYIKYRYNNWLNEIMLYMNFQV